jgi:pseudouridine kinase
MRRPKLLGIGGAHIDRRGLMTSDYIRGASIPGKMMEDTGGGMFNALRVAVQFGVSASMISVRGGDAAGDIVAAEIRRAGIEDLSSVFLDRTTASYTALLDRHGDVVAALADMEIYEKALPRQISRRKTRDAIADADALLIDANMPEESIVRLMYLAAGKPVYALAISPAKSVRLRPVLERLAGLYLNKREARAILGKAEDDKSGALVLAEGLGALGLQRAILTDGADAVCVMVNGETGLLQPPKPDHVEDVTGAGDALAGASLAALMSGKTIDHAVAQGLAAASATVESAKSIADFSSKSRFDALLQQMTALKPDN